MKNILFTVIITACIISCTKGDNYCEPPGDLNGFQSVVYFNDASKRAEVKLDFLQLFNDDQKGTLFSFYIPDAFINPKGDKRAIDIVSEPKYVYQLKDTANAPDSVLISAYAFNDCGDSETVSTWLRF